MYVCLVEDLDGIIAVDYPVVIVDESVLQKSLKQAQINAVLYNRKSGPSVGGFEPRATASVLELLIYLKLGDIKIKHVV